MINGPIRTVTVQIRWPASKVLLNAGAIKFCLEECCSGAPFEVTEVSGVIEALESLVSYLETAQHDYRYDVAQIGIRSAKAALAKLDVQFH